MVKDFRPLSSIHSFAKIGGFFLKKRKIKFTPLNYYKSSNPWTIINIQLRTFNYETDNAIQLLKSDKFDSLGGFKGSFLFCANKKYSI